jgi:asparagine synthase (glutamine-hydrolysing)
MHGMGGQLRFDNSQVGNAWLRSLAARLTNRFGSSTSTVKSGPAGLGQIGCVASSGDDIRCILTKTRDGSVLVFDGRLDNSAELAQSLRLPYDDRRESIILLALLARDGAVGAAKQLVGDFALVYWDARSCRLSLMRDHIGARVLYYSASAQHITFANDIGTLLDLAQLPRRLDDTYIAGFLSYGIPEERTPYRDVRSVTPGHVLTWSLDSKVVDEVAWALAEQSTTSVLKDDREYEEEFQRLFKQSIAVRVNSTDRTVAELSGGLDSSSVVCMADRVARESGSDTPARVSTVSYIFDTSTTADERSYIAGIAEHCHREPFLVLESKVPYFTTPKAPAELHMLSQFHFSSGFEQAVCDRMRTVGARLLLTGLGGDEMFYPTNLPTPGLSDLYVQRRYITLHRQLKEWSAAVQLPYLHLLWKVVRMTLIRRAFPPGALRWSGPRVPRFVHSHLREHVHAIGRTYELQLRDYDMPSVQDFAAGFHSVRRLIASGYRQEFNARDVTYPCLHRPLVEFLCAIPFTQRLRRSESRSLQRRSLTGILPESVRARRGKADLSEAVIRGLRGRRETWEPLLADSCADRARYIDAKEALSVLRRVSAGMWGKTPQPFRALSVELWLRSRDCVAGSSVSTASETPLAMAGSAPVA